MDITGQQVHQELNYGALLEPKLRKIFYETYEEVPEIFSQIYKVHNSKKAVETDYGLGAMTPWEEFGSSKTAVTGSNPMPTVPYDTFPEGQERFYRHKEFAKGFMIERKFIDDEMYNIIEKMPRDLARAGRYKVESDAASLFNNAFSANVGGNGESAIYDGKPLISADHPLLCGGTCSNLVTGALSDTTLKQALILGRQQKDEAGKIIQLNFDTLIVPPELEFTAYELVNSTHKVGTDYNDVNSLKGRFKIIVNPFLTNPDAWFIIDSKRHELNFFWRVRPEFKREEDFDTLVYKYRGYMRYSFGVSDWRGIIGSPGTDNIKEETTSRNIPL